MKFTKMEGLGNDYVYINCFSEKVENPEKLAIAMSDRHFGVGSDGVILIKILQWICIMQTVPDLRCVETVSVV